MRKTKALKISKRFIFFLIVFISIIIILVLVLSSNLILILDINNSTINSSNSSVESGSLISNNMSKNQTNNLTLNNDSYYDSFPRDKGEFKLYFCNYNNCSLGLIEAINASENISCAFYDIDIKPLIYILEEKNADMIFDIQLEQDKLLENITNKKFMRNSGVMHNKFCILDDNIVITGSMNPTKYGTHRNNNNLIIINSEIMKNNYLQEFEYLKNGQTPNVTNYFVHDNYIIEDYFLPHDSTINRVIDLIYQAKYSILVAAFSLTSDDIADALVYAYNNQVNVKVVIESRNKNGLGSDFTYLQDEGIEIYEDTNKGSMHHKFIVIDEKVVITGSPNFSNNGFNKNSENMLIIYNSDISSSYCEEFYRLIDQNTT